LKIEYVSIGEEIFRMKITNVSSGIDRFLNVLTENDGLLIQEMKKQLISNKIRINEILNVLNDNCMKLVFQGENDFKTDIINLFIDDFGFSYDKIIKNNVVVREGMGLSSVKFYDEEKRCFYSENEIVKMLNKQELEMQCVKNDGEFYESLIESIEIQHDTNLNKIEMQFDFQNNINNLETEDIKAFFIYIIDLFHAAEDKLEKKLSDVKYIIDKAYPLKVFVFRPVKFNDNNNKAINEHIDNQIVKNFAYKDFHRKRFIDTFIELKEEWKSRRTLKLSKKYNEIMGSLLNYLFLCIEAFTKVSVNYQSMDLEFEKINSSIIKEHLLNEIEQVKHINKDIVYKEIDEFRYKAKLQYAQDDFKADIEKIKKTFIENMLDNKIAEACSKIVKQLDEKFDKIAQKNCISVRGKEFSLRNVNYNKFGEDTKFDITLLTPDKSDSFFSRSIESIKGLIYLQKNRKQIVRTVNLEVNNKFKEAYSLFFDFLYKSSLEDILKYKNKIEKEIKQKVEESYKKAYGDLSGIYNLQDGFVSILFDIAVNKVKEDVSDNELES
jgi:hypothetical protein